MCIFSNSTLDSFRDEANARICNQDDCVHQEKEMGSLSVWHWLIVLVIVMLVFGTKKLGNVGADLGKAVKGFKDGVNGDEPQAAQLSNEPKKP